VNNRGQAALWEVALTLAVIAGFYIWYSMKHPAEANTFKDKSQQHQFNVNNNGFRLFDMTCVPRDISDQWGKNERTTNSQINSSH
jgi:high-affinity Fe2+/Pb2+ permease